jgi:hypothetical protein
MGAGGFRNLASERVVPQHFEFIPSVAEPLSLGIPVRAAGLRNGRSIPYAIPRSRQAITRAIDTISDPKA